MDEIDRIDADIADLHRLTRVHSDVLRQKYIMVKIYVEKKT